jgi:uncharacterized SAM-binding protein YcdF (DUF218 family)
MAGVWSYLWRTRRLDCWAKIIGTTALVVLWMVCTPVMALVLERPLITESSLKTDANNPTAWAPEYIFVLSGGYELGDVPEADSAGLETVRRVHRAVLLWREFPTSLLVMAGAQPGLEGIRAPNQQGLIMQNQAVQLGVPLQYILIDAVSTNTASHADVARKMPGVTSTTPLAIVTSDFHLRRSRHEFSRFFSNIRMLGSDPDITDDSFADLRISSLIPRVDALRESTVYLREYVALMLSDLRYKNEKM